MKIIKRLLRPRYQFLVCVVVAPALLIFRHPWLSLIPVGYIVLLIIAQVRRDMQVAKARGPLERLIVIDLIGHKDVPFSKTIWWDNLPFDQLVKNIDISCRVPQNSRIVAFLIAFLMPAIFGTIAIIPVWIFSGMPMLYAAVVSWVCSGVVLGPFGFFLGLSRKPIPYWLTVVKEWIAIPNKETGEVTGYKAELAPFNNPGIVRIVVEEEIEIETPTKVLIPAGANGEMAKPQMEKRKIKIEKLINLTSEYLATVNRQPTWKIFWQRKFASPQQALLRIGALGIIAVATLITMFLVIGVLGGK